MQKADPLIRTKLHMPFTRPGLVVRPRLHEQVMQGLCGPLTLITASAGFGKTTLVASCVAGCGMPAAWLSLEKNDNHPGSFLRYLVAALQEADPAIGKEAEQMLAAQQTSPAAALTSLINDLDTIRKDIVLVLDDYQLISSQAVHEEVAFFLDHCPSTFHMVIATRSDPPLPLARLRARGLTVELRTADLRFNVEEAVHFLNEIMGLNLDAQSINVLEERTEGWIAGLQMAALSMRGRQEVEGFIEAFAGTNRFIMDFMLEEVLAREPEEVQAFLLQTAILNRMSGPLCDAVTGAAGGQEMLEQLERRNLFVVPLDDDRRWYRYHHLFADLLQARLTQLGPERVARLYARAIDWCEREGLVNEAVGYAFAAKNFQRAAELVERYWQRLTNNGEIETVWSWLNALPEEIMRNSASLGVAYCGILWLTGQTGAIEPHLVDAERALSQMEVSGSTGSAADAQDYAQLSAALAAMRSFVARHHEDFETALTLAERALHLIPSNIPIEDSAQLSSLANLSLASAYDGAGKLEEAVSAYTETIRLSRLSKNASGMAITYRMIGALRLLGRLRAADAACQDALTYLRVQGMARLPAAGILHIAMSEVLVEQNHLEAAQAHLEQGIELGKWSGRLDAVKNAAYVLSRMRLMRQDAGGALAAVQEAGASLPDPPAPMARADLLALRVRILVWQGDLREAEKYVEEATRMVGKERGQAMGAVTLAAARLLVAQRAPAEATARLAQSIREAEERGWFGMAIELHILRALVLARQGNDRAAEAELERALAMAEPEGYARIFLDEGQPMRMLIGQWLARAGANSLRAYASSLLSQLDAEIQAAADAEQASPNNMLVEPLTERELEVLRLMALGSTNQEIARQLIVAPGTIKAHAASIYRKLDAANRTEAVMRARQLGILP